MLSGTVIFGEGKGKLLGYPTANLHLSPEETDLDEGVYAVWAILAEKKYSGALVVDYMTKKVEVHMLDLEEKWVYGQELRVDPIEKVSDLIRFDDEQKLREKITRDIEAIEQICNSLK